MTDVRDRVTRVLEGAGVGSLISGAPAAVPAPIARGLFDGADEPLVAAGRRNKCCDVCGWAGDDCICPGGPQFKALPGGDERIVNDLCTCPFLLPSQGITEPTAHREECPYRAEMLRRRTGGPEPDDAPALLTVEQARDLGFTGELIAALQEAGVVEPPRGYVWREPETLADMNRILGRCKTLQLEADGILATAQRRADELLRQADARVAPLRQAAASWERYRVLFEDLTARSLPRTRAGKLKAKSLPLGEVTVSLKAKAAGYAVTDEAQVLDHLRKTDPDGITPLAAALKATRTETRTGVDALDAVRTMPDVWKPKFDVNAVKAYIGGLPLKVDRETGEQFPATLPGVVFQEAAETWSWE